MPFVRSSLILSTLEALRRLPLEDSSTRGLVDLRYRGDPNILDVEPEPGFDFTVFCQTMRRNSVQDASAVLVSFEGYDQGKSMSVGFRLMTALRQFIDRLLETHTNSRFGRQLPCQEAWAHYVRCFAGTTRPIRVDLDPESYALEVEESAYCTTSLHSAWADFVNAVCDDISDYTGLQAPVFVFAFEDMHLNPDLNRGLRQSLRSMAHPRLVYLFGRTSNVEAERFGETLRRTIHECKNSVVAPPKPVLSPWARTLLEDDEFT